MGEIKRFIKRGTKDSLMQAEIIRLLQIVKNHEERYRRIRYIERCLNNFKADGLSLITLSQERCGLSAFVEPKDRDEFFALVSKAEEQMKARGYRDN